jgi:cyclophilin family peptidyl-prolyl cis-trans isomerase
MMPLRIAVLVVSITWAAAGVAQEPAEVVADPLRLLRAEATVECTLFGPSQPVPVRFTLFNPTSEPIELPVSRARSNDDGIALPLSLIIGTGEQPALFISYDNEKPVALQPESSGADEERADVLRLAPRASLGAEIDLRSLHREMRYSGDYQLEWQPLGGRVGAVSLSFRVEPRKDAVLVTDYGKITFSLMYDEAPRNVENFLELIRERFYDGKAIHRLVPGFIIQGGSPDGSGKGVRPDGKFVRAEFHDAPFEVGTLAMARKPSDPDSASCQFFISLARLEELDGKYTVIGQARDVESLRTLKQIEELPTNSDGRTLRPLAIRFFTLVDIPVTETRQLESSRP